MKKGIKLDNYNQLTIQEIYSDDSKGKKFYIKFIDNFLKLEVDAPAWKFFACCTEVIDIMKEDIIGVNLYMIREELSRCGYIEVE